MTDVFSLPDGRTQLLDELRNRGFVKNRILSLKRTDNTPVTVSVTALAEFNENKDLVFINGIVQDISGLVNPGPTRRGPLPGTDKPRTGRTRIRDGPQIRQIPWGTRIKILLSDVSK